MPIADSEFKLLDRPPTKPDHYIARRVQSQFIYFVDVSETEDGLMAKIRGTKTFEPVDSFHKWWSIPEPYIPLIPWQRPNTEIEEFENCLFRLGVPSEVDYGIKDCISSDGLTTVSVSQAHFKFDKDGLFVQVEDDETSVTGKRQ